MLKWIILIFAAYFCLGIFLLYQSNYTQISKQIDVKTMSFIAPKFIVDTYSVCEGDCTNYYFDSLGSSSSSSWGGSSSSGK